MLRAVHAQPPPAQLHHSGQVVEEQRFGIPLYPGPQPDKEGPAALSQRQHSDLQNPRGDVLQVQALQATPQPIRGQGGAKNTADQETQSVPAG